jgi:hypothetical protein
MCRRGALAPGVRRYVLLTQSRGGTRCPAPNAVKVGVLLHSWCDAGLCGIYFILAFAKTPDRSGQAVTPGGSPRREPWWAVAPTTKLSSFASKLSRHGAAIAYTDLLGAVFIYTELL